MSLNWIKKGTTYLIIYVIILNSFTFGSTPDVNIDSSNNNNNNNIVINDSSNNNNINSNNNNNNNNNLNNRYNINIINQDNKISASSTTAIKTTNNKYNEYLCPSHKCDPGVLCRNMFGNYQCGSQYDAYATIDSMPVKRWSEGDHIYTMYKSVVSNLNTIPLTSFILHMDFVDRVINKTIDGMVRDEMDDPDAHLIHLPSDVEYVLQSKPYEFTYVLRGMNNDVATTIRFKMISFTTIPKKNIIIDDSSNSSSSGSSSDNNNTNNNNNNSGSEPMNNYSFKSCVSSKYKCQD